MKRCIPLVLVLALGCAHKPMTNRELARSTAAVGAAVVITSALVYAEYRATPDLSAPSAVALPPK